MKEIFAQHLSACPVIAILRGVTPAEITDACDALFAAGITILEIPLNSPDAVRSIGLAVRHCGDRQLVGAGTVLKPEEVDAVHGSGGTFIISPNTNPAVIKRTKELGMISIPGFFTATEAFAAVDAGADYLKLFPAILGPGYVKDLKAVVKAPIMAVGGVNQDNAAEFLKVCCGLGIGSALYQAGKSLDDLRRDAKAFVEIIK